MKIKMSFDLITFKINQIKNKVQYLHESSIKDDKILLKKNKNNFNNAQQIQKINSYNFNNKNNYNYNVKNKINNRTIVDDFNKCNGIYNNDSYMNMNMNMNLSSENRINNFRTSKNDKMQYLTLNQNKKYNPNKKVLKFISSNSSNNQITSISNNNNKANFNKQSNLSKNDINKINNINRLKERIIQCYNKKNDKIMTESNDNQNNCYNSLNEKEIKKNIPKKNIKNSVSINGIRYGSFDKYFIDNNNNKYNNQENTSLNNNNNRNKFCYNNNTYNGKKESFDQDKYKQIQEINKILNKNQNTNRLKKRKITDINLGERINDNKTGFIINDNKSNLNLTVQNNKQKYLSLKQFIKDEINNNDSASSRKNKNKNDESIKNYNYFLNKEGDVFQNNYINNNFSLKSSIKEIDNNKNQIKKFKKPIQIKTKNRDNKNIKSSTNSQLSINNKKIIINRNNNNIDNNYRLKINNIPKYRIKKNKPNNNENDIGKNMNFKKREKLKINEDYSKDDILRLSIYNKEEDHINNIIKMKRNNNIFDILLKEEMKEQISPTNNKLKDNSLLYNTITNSFSAKNKINNKNFFTNIINTDTDTGTDNDLNKGIIKDFNSNDNKMQSINEQKIIQFKEKKYIPRCNKELHVKVFNNPQQFHTIKLNDLVFKNYCIKKNLYRNNRNDTRERLINEK
jgi:hypothetical protein